MMRRPFLRRPWRREVSPLALALALPVVLASAFPRESLSFRPRDGATPVCSCAFVTLSPEQERKALTASRTAWQPGADGMRGLKTEMFAVPLAEFRPDEVVAFPGRTPFPVTGDFRFETWPTPPSVAAPVPTPLAPAPAAVPAPAFSRDELLVLPDW